MELADEVVRIPASAYTDEALFEREKRQIFRRLPLMVAPSCELPQPGDFKAMDICGVPLLLTRQKDGSVGAFLLFDWPPLLHEIVAGYLAAFLASPAAERLTEKDGGKRRIIPSLWPKPEFRDEGNNIV